MPPPVFIHTPGLGEGIFFLPHFLERTYASFNQLTAMNPNIHPFYRHSGKFNPLAPLLAVLAALVAGWPLGLLYAYLIKWIPFIYLNVFLTIGYGFVFGLLTLFLLKATKVRNGAVALLSGVAVGLLAWYFSWSGHVHALAGKTPWLLTPGQVWAVAKLLYAEGSWGLGLFGHEPLTGIPLAVVWLVEGAVMVGLSALVSYSSVGSTPYCEQHQCWLDEEKIMDKLDAFTQPAHLEAFKAGDIAPLEAAQPRVPASGKFARLTLKHSARCDDFCTLSIANIEVSTDKEGKPVEKSTELMTNLLVPKSMFEYLAQFDHPTAKARPAGI